MNAIYIEARRLLRDRRVALLRLAGDEAAALSEPRNQAVEALPVDISLRAPEASPQELSESHRLDVAQIDAALTRIEAGTYGECESCGHAIGRQRLRAIPEARLCVTCRSLRLPEPGQP